MTKQHTHKAAIFALCMVIFIDALGFGVIYPILAPIMLDNSTGMFAADTSIATRNLWYEGMIGIYCLCMFLASPILGSLSDRYGRKIVLIMSMWGNAIGFLMGGVGLITNSLELIVIGRVISGLTAGGLPIAQAAMMDISTDEEKPKRLSLVTIANVVGFVVGPVAGGFFLDQGIWGTNLHYDLPFWVVSFVAFAVGVLVMTSFKETYHGNPDVKIHPLTGFINIFEGFCQKSTRNLLWSFTFFMLGWALFFSLVPLLVSEKFGWDPSLVGYFISFIALAFAVGILFLIPRLMKRFTLPGLVLSSLCALTLASFLFHLVDHAFYLWFVSFLLLGTPLAYIGLATLASSAVSVDEQGKIMGVIGSLFALSWGVGPFVASYSARMGVSEAYWTAFVLFAIAVIWFKLGYKAKAQ